jgi:hypothetical protein
MFKGMEEKAMLEERTERNRLRSIVVNAEDREIITKEEAGFIVSLVERFRLDIEKKIKQLHVLQGEISQLKSNEAIIVDLVENMISAAERDLARQETMNKLKAAREVQEDRRQALREKTQDESADIVNKEDVTKE